MQKWGFEPDSNEEIIALNFNVFPVVRVENTAGWRAGGLTLWPHCSSRSQNSSGCGLAISVRVHSTELPKAFKLTIISIPIFNFEVPSYLKQLFFSFSFFFTWPAALTVLCLSLIQAPDPLLTRDQILPRPFLVYLPLVSALSPASVPVKIKFLWGAGLLLSPQEKGDKHSLTASYNC